ncbi:hypothetical protein AB0E75_27455 [Streptomyces griseoviridis]|nr:MULTISPECIES: hypothetical protein [Streptomyces]MDP9686233.1 hypothetical protein [Streptomyces griseoviridis]GGT15502.1 hypothetical protein GCM10010240_55860 [Streptomyces griseoviridis]GGU57371.1 hypothetical protein GCM10010259_55490 [Streptomyces daghestanicus]GHI35525.1 hypothetical protein Sdagh_72550 [Streptomyces daghestanicus]
MDDMALRERLDAVRGRIGELRIREAWLLLAMGRLEAAVEAAGEARREAAGPTVPAAALRDVLREAAWVTCAARIGQRQWTEAQMTAERLIDLCGRDPRTVRLRELACWGRGTLGPIATWQAVLDPAKELAAFDPAAFARDHLAEHPGDDTGPAVAHDEAAAPVVPFYQGDRGRLPVDEDALREELAAVTDETGERAWAPHIHRAWLLIALSRYEDALEEVEAARREYYGFLGMPAERHFAEALFEDGCEAEAVADMALERWDAAADAGLRGLADHGGSQRNDPLVRMIAVARGTVTGDWDTWRVQLTAFDPVQYALHVLRRRPAFLENPDRLP